MNKKSILSPQCLLLLLLTPAMAQNQSAASPPVSYSSISQLNQLLSQLEQTSQQTQLDLAKLRVEKWKTDSNNKRQMQANVESIERNLQSALPEMIGQLRMSPENLTATFRVYRNLTALYDVFAAVAESPGAFGSKDEFKALENDLTMLERSRRAFADRMETLAGAKEAELTRLRTALQTGQGGANPQQTKKVIVDDNEPPKKPARKKSSTKSTPPPPQAKPQ
jgi:ribosomal protein L29